MIFALAQYLNHVVDIQLVVLSPDNQHNQMIALRSCMLQRFPRKHQSHNIKSVALNPRKMIIRLVQSKRGTYKRDSFRSRDVLVDM
jgi:hypothetical protein